MNELPKKSIPITFWERDMIFWEQPVDDQESCLEEEGSKEDPDSRPYSATLWSSNSAWCPGVSPVSEDFGTITLSLVYITKQF